jgi:transposase
LTADRAGVRRFLGRFRGRRLEVALEATTGWRFVIQELRAIGAEVRLAEPAETAARRGRKRRPKTDRADARHLRALLMVDRLPQSWIPPDHILDLRARVRLRHTLVDQRGEWQQRIHAVLYHHGRPHHHGIGLLTVKGRQWLEGLGLPPTALEQVTVAAADDRHAGRPGRADRQAAARLRAPPAGLSGRRWPTTASAT